VGSVEEKAMLKKSLEEIVGKIEMVIGEVFSRAHGLTPTIACITY
jgi:tetrahydromethanopterin S-methyltransferase subunit G